MDLNKKLDLTVKEILNVDPLYFIDKQIFTSLEEVHNYKIKEVWGGIDIMVSIDELLKEEF